MTTTGTITKPPSPSTKATTTGAASSPRKDRKDRRGFASMSLEKRREIASKGGKAAHAQGTAHRWTREEAQEAGRKGGSISRIRGPRAPRKQKPL